MVDLQQRISNEDDVRKRTSDLAKIELQQQHIDDEPNVIKRKYIASGLLNNSSDMVSAPYFTA